MASRVRRVGAGTADGALKIMLEDPVPKRFAQVRQRSGKSFPAAPEIATEALCDARARNVSALESSLIRAHGAFGLGANADAGGRRAARQARRASLMAMHKAVNAHKYASIFRKPVNPRDAPNYDTIITEPMDLGTIKRNIDADGYPTLSAFSRDVRLICLNTIKFNGKESDYYVYGCELMAHGMDVVEAELHRQRQDTGMAAASDTHAWPVRASR